MPEEPPPEHLYDTAGIRRLEELAIDVAHIPASELMRRAGAATLDYLQKTWPTARRIGIVCGQGNNAGDGYVVAKLARQADYDVRVLQLGGAESFKEPAREHVEHALAAGVCPQTGGEVLDEVDVVVDAVFGIGLNRELAATFNAAIDAINALDIPILSIDIPSGINANTGARMGTAVRASATCSFLGLKQGLFTGDAPDHIGELVFDDLGVPHSLFANVPPKVDLLEWDHVKNVLQPRARIAHKGDHGHVLVLGGAPGYAGAVQLAATAAARVGAGLVSCAVCPDVAATLNAGRPELMVHAAASASTLDRLLSRASVIVVGPGLGTSAWARRMFSRIIEWRGPLVVDADALNLLAADPTHRDDWILTPHPGEAARLLGCRNSEIHIDRYAAARALVEQYGGQVVLKGAGSIVVGDERTAVVRAGNPGMGSGGMGDVLAGLLGGLCAQGCRPAEALRLGVVMHGVAADRAAADDGERGMLASDLLPWLRRLAN